MKEIKYTISYCVFVGTFVIPFYYGSGKNFLLWIRVQWIRRSKLRIRILHSKLRDPDPLIYQRFKEFQKKENYCIIF
jgi:hypothetical protein